MRAGAKWDKYLYLGPGRISFSVNKGKVTQLRGSPPPIAPTVEWLEWLEEMVASRGWRKVRDDPRYVPALKSLLYSPIGTTYKDDQPSPEEVSKHREWWAVKLSVPVDLILDWEQGIDRPTDEQRLAISKEIWGNSRELPPKKKAADAKLQPWAGRCARCGSEGHDLRTIWMACTYDMRKLGIPLETRLTEGVTYEQVGEEEVDVLGRKRMVPKFSDVQGGSKKRVMHTITVCKKCRGQWLEAVRQWFSSEHCGDPVPKAQPAKMTPDDWKKLGTKPEDLPPST